MSHDHEHRNANLNAPFKIAVALNLAIVVFEAVYGFLGHSVALLADASHNLTDVLALALAWGSNVLASRRPTRTRTYGLRRTTILASLLNAVLLMVTTGAILLEAIQRLLKPITVEGLTMAWVAGAALVLNGASAALFARGRKSDLNVKGAFLHMLSDAAVSAGVVVAGLVMYWTGILWLDPAMSIIIAVVITIGTWSLLRDSFNLAADAVPEKIDIDAVEQYLHGLPHVVEVHDLHIWGMSTTHVAMTAHVVVDEFDSNLLDLIAHELHRRFGIDHATIQPELTGGGACPLAPKHVV